MKIKHNKKRNTAFIYEALIKETTASILKNDAERKQKAVNLIIKHFNSNSILNRELDCYRSLYENQKIDRETSEKIIREAKIASRLIDPSAVFVAQTELIGDINKTLGPRLFNNFVPNYKTLATISQIFSNKMSPKKAVMLENQILDAMCASAEASEDSTGVDNLVIKKFTSKFNEKYSNELLGEQKMLLSFYIESFTDNALELKTFLNEEIFRLKGAILDAKKKNEFSADLEMIKKADKIIEKLDSFYKQEVDEKVLLTVLKTQQLVKEIENHGDYN
jgi:hypothetical protein